MRHLVSHRPAFSTLGHGIAVLTSLPRAGAAVALTTLGFCTPQAAFAQEAAPAQSDVAALRDLVAKQASVIDELQRRVSSLEANQTRVAPAPQTQTEPTALALAPMAEVPHEKPQPIKVDWSQGAPVFSMADGTSFHVRGRLWVDASSTTGSRFSTRNFSGTELNSVRLGADGTLGQHWGYKIEVDFANGDTSLKENFIEYRTSLWGKQLQLFAGNKTGDRGIDASSYDGFVPFFQRSMLATSIGPEKGIFGVGFLAKLGGKDWHVGLDIVGDDANGNAGTAGDTLAYIGRATWTPELDDLTRVHFGAWGYYENISDRRETSLTRSVSPGEHFDQSIKITMTPIANPRWSTGEGGEIGVLRGSFWAFGEYGRRHIDALGETRNWSSKVAMAGFFLTGERPNFSPVWGSWTDLSPRKSVFSGGRGAIELVARYEDSDLGHAEVAGSGHDLTLGTNWYLSRNARVLLDWVHWTVINPTGAFAGRDTGETFNIRLDTSF